MRHQTPQFSLALLGGLLLCVLCAGCGGNLKPAVAPALPAVSTDDAYSTTFHVDVKSREVSVSSLPPTPGMIGTAAVLTGTAVAFETSPLVDEAEDVGVKALSVRVVNQTRRSLTNARLLFSDITNAPAWSDPRPKVQVSTVAGTGASGFTEGAATAARFSSPTGVAVDKRGDVYIADLNNNRVRKLSAGVVSTVAGDGTAGSVNGQGTAARLNKPAGLVFCPRDDAIYVTESGGHRVSRIDRAGYVCTIAGTGVAGGANGKGNVATFNEPTGLATDGQSVYLTDAAGHRVRKIAYTGSNPRAPASYTVTTVAGDGTAGTVNGVGTAARFNRPYGICMADDGALYIAEQTGRRIRRLDPRSQAVVTIAGTGVAGNANGFGNVATFRSPNGIAALRDTGRGPCLVVSEGNNHLLRQIRLGADGTASPSSARSWIVHYLAGAPQTAGNKDGTGVTARLNAPRLIATDASSNILLADCDNHTIRRVRPTSGFFPIGMTSGVPPGEPIVLANADGWSPWAGGSDRPFIVCPDLANGATSEPLTWSFAVPSGVTAFEFTVTVEARTDPYAPVGAVPGGTGGVGSPRVLVRTLAGSTSGVDGFIDGVGTNARFRCLIGTTVDANGVVYTCDADNDAIRRIEPNGRVSTVAGSLGTDGLTNGRGNVAQFDYPTGVAAADFSLFSTSGAFAAGTKGVFLFVADLDNYVIRLIRGPHTGWNSALPWEPWNPAFYQVATIAGTGVSGYANGTGDTAQFAAPSAMAVGPGGIVYVLERVGGSRVRTLRWLGGDPMLPQNWKVSLLAGATDGSSGYVNAAGSSARFNDPRGVTVDARGTVFVADTYNHCIRAITPDGTVSTLAGTNTSGCVDGGPANARFSNPWSVAAGPDGYLYVADRYNYRIRRVSPSGVASTVAGTGASTRQDGPGNQAGFNDDLGIAVGPGGDVYVPEAECLRLIERVVDIGDVIASAP